MMRYATIPWPLAGIFVAIVLVAFDLLLAALGANAALAQTAYRMLVWTIGLSSLALLLLPGGARPTCSASWCAPA